MKLVNMLLHHNIKSVLVQQNLDNNWRTDFSDTDCRNLLNCAFNIFWD